MASLAAGNRVGDAMTLLWNEKETHVGFGTVAADVPFAIEIEGGACPGAGAELRLVRDQGDRWVVGSAIAASCEEGLVIVRKAVWEEPSQRVHERFEVEWPTTLRILDDRGCRETFQIGMTTDVSLGGAALYLDDAPEVGSLVEVKAHPPNSVPLRAVGVVVRRTGYNVGLAFLYVWGAAFLGTTDAQPLLMAA